MCIRDRFDGEGCVTYKQYWCTKRENRPRSYYCWRIQMEIVMTHEPTIKWCADTFGGRCIPKPRKELKNIIKHYEREEQN